MRRIADANAELKGVFTVDWNLPAPDGSGAKLIPNEVVVEFLNRFSIVLPRTPHTPWFPARRHPSNQPPGLFSFRRAKKAAGRGPADWTNPP